jgi:hypothetical protein
MAVFIADLKHGGRLRNPDFPASKGPIFTRLRACGSFQINTVHIVTGLATLTRAA